VRRGPPDAFCGGSADLGDVLAGKRLDSSTVCVRVSAAPPSFTNCLWE
jgi:hypothetical protein